MNNNRNLYIALFQALKALDAHITELELDYNSVEKHTPEWLALMARNNLRQLTGEIGMKMATGGE